MALSLNSLKKYLAAHWQAILLAGIVVLGAFLRFWHIDQRCFSGDGVLVLDVISRSSARQVWQEVAVNLRPDLPLSYIFLYYWSLFGKSVFWLRSISALSGILVIFLSYKFTKYLFDKKVALLVTFLVAVSPLRVLYNQSMRYYSLNGLLNLLSMYLFITALRSDRKSRWFFYILARTISIYMNYSSLLFFLSEVFFIIFYRIEYAKNFKRWLLCFITILILWLPMRPLFLSDLALLLSGDGFERAPFFIGPIGNIFYFLFTFGIGKTISPFNYFIVALAAAVYLFVLVSFFRAFWRNKIPRQNAIFIMSSLAITVSLCALSNYNSPRYIMASGVLYSIIIACGILKMPNKKIIASFIIAIGLLRFYALHNLYHERQYITMEFTDDWDEIARYCAKNMDSFSDVVFYNSRAFAYYLSAIDKDKHMHKLAESQDEMRMFLRDSLEKYPVGKIILVDSPLSGKDIDVYAPAINLLNTWLRENNFKISDNRCFDEDPYAREKQKYLNRPFPACRTKVYIYSQGQ